MVRFQERRFSFKSLLKPFLMAMSFAYIAFHTFNGDHGVYAYLKEQRKLEVHQEELQALHDKREQLEKHVKLMSPESLDLDMLDEQARSVLGFAGKEEVVFITSPDGSSL